MPRVVVTATIPLGQSLSSSIDLAAGTADFVHMPSLWTPANLSFQISHDNVAFTDLMDFEAREVMVSAIGNTTIRLPADFAHAAAGWLKFRSGSRNYPILQAAARVITVSGFSGSAMATSET